MKMIDLFSGAGGLSEGLSEAGFHSLFASEIVPVYAQTYRRNHPYTKVLTEDIRKIDAESIRKELNSDRGELDLIAGGPPCQGFSINAPIRSTLDERNHLFKEYLRFVDAFAPRAVLIENVPGLVSFENGETLHAILNALAELGYGADVRILGAPYYGVPQMRWRTIILGVRGKTLPSNAYPNPIYHAPIHANFTSTFDGQSIIQEPSPEANANFVTVHQAIGDLPPLVSGEQGTPVKEYRCDPFSDYQIRARRGSIGVVNHEAPKLSQINLKRLEYIKPGGNWTDIPYDLLPQGMQRARKSDHTKRYGRVTPDGLASTILTKCDPHWGAFFHYEQNRSFTVREAARLQSFPDHFIFTGNQAEQFAQVGNAVPPLLAQAVGLSLRTILDTED
ncbi:MAG: DNA cytosine methyltransferase [Clostridia bacterium]|nr:DNA cytosine methyltransferase [Clostridia bacterium]